MVAENSLNRYATADLAEMQKATGQIPSDCQLIVYMDNSSTSPTFYLGTAKDGLSTLRTLSDDPISTDSATMESLLKYMIEAAPAQEYALVLWSHGTGWAPVSSQRRTFGVDNGSNTSSNNGTQMEITTLANVLQNVGVQWKYIFFDACFMQCIEIAYQLRSLCDWTIGSPAEIPANGAPYDSLMTHLFQASNFAQDIPAAYHDYYEENSNYGVVLSSIRSSELETLAQVTAQAVDTVSSLYTDGAQQYAAYTANTGWLPEFHDMASLMGQWLCDNDYATWVAAMQQAIPYRFSTDRWETSYSSVDARLTDSQHFAAASMYVPQEGRSGSNQTWSTLDWAKVVSALNLK